jgi:hypothetical protein
MSDGQPPDATEREPYESPRVVWEEALDERPGLIAACNKVEPLGGTCDTGSLSS